MLPANSNSINSNITNDGFTFSVSSASIPARKSFLAGAYKIKLKLNIKLSCPGAVKLAKEDGLPGS